MVRFVKKLKILRFLGTYSPSVLLAGGASENDLFEGGASEKVRLPSELLAASSVNRLSGVLLRRLGDLLRRLGDRLRRLGDRERRRGDLERRLGDRLRRLLGLEERDLERLDLR